MRLERELDFGRESEATKLGQQRIAESGLREQQEVVDASAPDGRRRDHARLRGQQQRLAGSPGPSASTSFETMRCRYDAASGRRPRATNEADRSL